MQNENEKSVFQNSFGTIFNTYFLINSSKQNGKYMFSQIKSIEFKRKRNYVLFATYFLLSIIFLNGAIDDWNKAYRLISIIVLVLALVMMLSSLAHLNGNFHIYISKTDEKNVKHKVKMYENKLAKEFIEFVQKKWNSERTSE